MRDARVACGFLQQNFGGARRSEENRVYINQSPKGEPQLGKRGLYRNIGGHVDAEAREMAMLWMLNQSDGEHSLLDIAERSGLAFDQLQPAARELEEHGLLKKQS